MLTKQQLETVVPKVIKVLSKTSIGNPLKAPQLVKRIKRLGVKRMDESILRNCCNHIRTNAILPVIATSQGYYVSRDKTVIQNQIDSLRKRAASINKSTQGLRRYLKTL